VYILRLSVADSARRSRALGRVDGFAERNLWNVGAPRYAIA
jgi:hypothetical protein